MSPKKNNTLREGFFSREKVSGGSREEFRVKVGTGPKEISTDPLLDEFVHFLSLRGDFSLLSNLRCSFGINSYLFGDIPLEEESALGRDSIVVFIDVSGMINFMKGSPDSNKLRSWSSQICFRG